MISSQYLVDPKTLRKAGSRVRDVSTPPLPERTPASFPAPKQLPNGDRVKSFFGFVIYLSTTKAFETFYEVLKAGIKTNTLKSTTKTKIRSYTVLEGDGKLHLGEGDDVTTVDLTAGVTVDIPAATAFVIETSSVMHVFVTQSPKYSTSLKVIEESIELAKGDYSMSDVPVAPPAPRTRSSKAAEQALHMRENAIQNQNQLAMEKRSTAKKSIESFVSESSGDNPQPIGPFVDQ